MQLFTQPLADVFGIAAPEHVTVDVFDNNDHAPRKTNGYVFDKDNLKLVLAYLTGKGNSTDGMLIHGPFGCGKTSLVREVLGRLNWPTLMLSWNENSDVADLVGHMGINFGDTQFQYGPLPRAMKEGYTLVINEIDRGRAGNLVALNDVLDGGYLHIPETGEVIEPHSNFRLFVTANSAGSGDHTGQYAGSVRRLDPAFLDRFIFLKSTYMPKADEADMFSVRYPNLSCEFITKMVELANETRGKATDPVDPLNLPFSTRSLDRAFRLMQSFGIGTMSADVKADDLMPAVKPAYLDRLSPDEEEAATTLLRMHFA